METEIDKQSWLCGQELLIFSIKEKSSEIITEECEWVIGRDTDVLLHMLVRRAPSSILFPYVLALHTLRSNESGCRNTTHCVELLKEDI